MDIEAKIRELAEGILPDQNHFVVDVLYLTKQRPGRLMVILDGDQGVTIETCASISRQLSKALDELNLLDAAYMLEVGTPGLDHPLKLKRQFFKNVGRQLKVHVKDKLVVLGKLESVTEQTLLIAQEIMDGKRKKEIKNIEVSFEDIEKAFVMVSFK